jgi:hypothetical protein
MLVAAVFFLLCAVMVRIATGETGRGIFVTLGLLAGVGFLMKAAMSITATVVLACVFLVTRPAVRRRIFVSVGVAAALAAAFAIPLSMRQHWPTLGESGKINYAWSVLGVQRDIHWQGAAGNGDAAGAPVHPTRVLSEDPPVFEFATPFQVHYPPWFDPGYWYDGLRLRFSPLRQLRVFGFNVVKLLPWLLESMFGAAIAIALVLALSRYRTALAAGRHLWFLPAVALVSMLVYCLVAIEKRYMMGYAIVFFLLPVLLSAALYRKHLALLTALFWIAFFGSLAPSTLQIAKEIVASGGHTEDDQWNVAADLTRAGLRPGDAVAAIDDTMYSAWPRLAQLRVIAEIPLRKNELPTDQLDRYWRAARDRQLQVLDLFRKAGARAVIANPPPKGSPAEGWIPVGKTGYLLLRL